MNTLKKYFLLILIASFLSSTFVASQQDALKESDVTAEEVERDSKKTDALVSLFKTVVLCVAVNQLKENESFQNLVGILGLTVNELNAFLAFEGGLYTLENLDFEGAKALADRAPLHLLTYKIIATQNVQNAVSKVPVLGEKFAFDVNNSRGSLSHFLQYLVVYNTAKKYVPNIYRKLSKWMWAKLQDTSIFVSDIMSTELSEKQSVN